MRIPSSTSLPWAPSRTVSWIHIGDPHLTRAGEPNEIDLGAIIDEIDAVYANRGIDFVFVPGDIADDGSAAAFQLLRRHLDRLNVPWFGIVGDHDVHEKSFDLFRQSISPELYGMFSIGPYRFLWLNALAIPRPDSFVVDEEQLEWLEAELCKCEQSGMKAVLFLHCYPSDLKRGGAQLTQLLHRYPVLLADMGHTHYNEISNDGTLLYSATRSTGQIEEGPVGYSVTTLDGDCVSWHFVPLGSPSLAVVTQPSDERLLTERTMHSVEPDRILIHAKIWSRVPIVDAHAEFGGGTTALHSDDGLFWTGEMERPHPRQGASELCLAAVDESGQTITSAIRVLLGDRQQRAFAPVDQDNAIGAWQERGLLGTQLGPNRNGRKW